MVVTELSLCFYHFTDVEADPPLPTALRNPDAFKVSATAYGPFGHEHETSIAWDLAAEGYAPCAAMVPMGISILANPFYGHGEWIPWIVCHIS